MRKILILSVITAVLLTGCYPNGSKIEIEDYVSENISVSSDPKKSYEFNPIDGKKSCGRKIYCTPVIFDEDIELIFLGEKKGTYTEEIHKKSQRVSQGNYYNYYRCESGEYLFYDAGSISYIKDFSKGPDYVFFTSLDDVYSKDEIKKIMCGEQIDNLDKKEVVNKVNDIISELSITVSEPDIYVINSDAANNNGLTEIEWDPEDDAYLLLYSIIYDGEKCSRTELNSISDTVVTLPSYIQVAYSRRGIEYFSCESVMSIISEDEKIELCDDIYAQTYIRQYAENLILDERKETMRVYGGELVYSLQYTDEDDIYVLYPVWSFGMDTKNYERFGGFNNSTLCVDALNGLMY